MRDDPHAAAIVELQPEDPPARPPGLYTACDCLLAPFRSGDHGIIAEAMTCGLPVIAPDRDGWLDHCNAATAFLASAPGTIDTGALIGLMHHVVAQPAAARAVGERAAAALQRVGSIGAAPFPPGLTACIDACTDRGAGTTIDRCLDSLAGLAAQVVVVTLPGDQAGAVVRERGRRRTRGGCVGRWGHGMERGVAPRQPPLGHHPRGPTSTSPTTAAMRCAASWRATGWRATC